MTVDSGTEPRWIDPTLPREMTEQWLADPRRLDALRGERTEIENHYIDELVAGG